MKITSYKGVIYRVPYWVKYIVSDQDGMVVAHEELPTKCAHEWQPQKGMGWLVLAESDNPCREDGWGEPKRI